MRSAMILVLLVSSAHAEEDPGRVVVTEKREPYTLPQEITDKQTECDKGSAPACRTLGAWYARGTRLVGECLPTAARYFRRACKLGDKTVCPAPMHKALRALLHQLRDGSPAPTEPVAQTANDPPFHRLCRAEREQMYWTVTEEIEHTEALDEEIRRPGTYDEKACDPRPFDPGPVPSQLTDTKRLMRESLDRPVR